jgi:hypothetical protein
MMNTCWFWQLHLLLVDVLLGRSLQVVDRVIESLVKQCHKFFVLHAVRQRPSQKPESGMIAKDGFLYNLVVLFVLLLL